VATSGATEGTTLRLKPSGHDSGWTRFDVERQGAEEEENGGDFQSPGTIAPGGRYVDPAVYGEPPWHVSAGQSAERNGNVTEAQETGLPQPSAWSEESVVEEPPARVVPSYGRYIGTREYPLPRRTWRSRFQGHSRTLPETSDEDDWPGGVSERSRSPRGARGARAWISRDRRRGDAQAFAQTLGLEYGRPTAFRGEQMWIRGNGDTRTRTPPPQGFLVTPASTRLVPWCPLPEFGARFPVSVGQHLPHAQVAVAPDQETGQTWGRAGRFPQGSGEVTFGHEGQGQVAGHRHERVNHRVTSFLGGQQGVPGVAEEHQGILSGLPDPGAGPWMHAPREERLDGMGRMGVQDMVRGGPTVVIPGANYVGRTLMSLRHALFKTQGFPKDWPDRALKRKITEEIVAMSLKRRRDSLLRSPEPVDAAVGENSNGSSVEIGDPNAEMEEPEDPLQDANLEEEALRELVTQGEDLMEDIVDQDGCQDEIKEEPDEEDVEETEGGEDEPLLVLDEVEAEASSDTETPEPDEQQG
jgi:hypothetical protein